MEEIDGWNKDGEREREREIEDRYGRDRRM